MFLIKHLYTEAILIIGVFRCPTFSEHKDVLWNYICEYIKSTVNKIWDSHSGVYKDCSCVGCGAL